MSTTSTEIFSNPLFATYSVYAHNASINHQRSHHILNLLTHYRVKRKCQETTDSLK